VQKNQNQQGNDANQSSKSGNDQQSQSSGGKDQQGGQKSQLTPSGGSNGGSNQQSQSGGGRDQQGSNLKSDPGQAQSRAAQPSQQGAEQGNRSDKQR
jgi:hypothetical protein